MDDVFVKKTVDEMGDEVYRKAVDASALELYDIVSNVMRQNKDNPNDVILRAKIGKRFRENQRVVA